MNRNILTGKSGRNGISQTKNGGRFKRQTARLYYCYYLKPNRVKNYGTFLKSYFTLLKKIDMSIQKSNTPPSADNIALGRFVAGALGFEPHVYAYYDEAEENKLSVLKHIQQRFELLSADRKTAFQDFCCEPILII